MGFGIIIDILIMACGVYMIYWAVQMKSSGKIPVMLVGKGFPINRAKDTKGFIKFTFPITFGTGVVLLTTGLTGALDILALHPLADSLMRMGTVVIVIIYGVLLLKAQKKYLIGITE